MRHEILYDLGMTIDIMTNGIIRLFSLVEQCHTRDQQESRWSLGIDIFCAVSSLRLRLFQSQSWSRH